MTLLSAIRIARRNYKAAYQENNSHWRAVLHWKLYTDATWEAWRIVNNAGRPDLCERIWKACQR